MGPDRPNLRAGAPTVVWEQRGGDVTVHFIGAGPARSTCSRCAARDLIAASPVCLYAGTYVPPEMLDAVPAGGAEDRHRAT